MPDAGGRRARLHAVSSADRPAIVTLRTLDDGAETMYIVHDAGEADPRVGEFDLQPPTFHTFPSADGRVTLQAAAYLPDAEVHGPGPHPTGARSPLFESRK